MNLDITWPCSRAARLAPAFAGVNGVGGRCCSPSAIRSSSSLVLLLRDRGELGYSHGVDGLPFAHEILSLHDHAAAVGKAGDPHEALLVLDDANRNELDRVVGVDGAQAEIASRGKGQRRARDARRQNRQQRHDELRRDAVGIAAVGVGQLDLDAIGARGRARGLGHESDFSARALAGHEPHLGDAADLDAGELALGHFDHRQHRIERDERGDLAAGHGKRGLSDLDRNVVDDARPRGAHHAAVVLGLGGGKRGLRGLELRLEIDELEPRQRAAHDQRAFSLELGALLRHHGLSLRHLGLARLVGEDGDDVALLDRHSALDLEVGQHPAGARGHGDVLVGLGAAGDGELAAVGHDGGRRHRDAERLFRRAVAGAHGHAALAALMRNEMAGCDPKRGGGHETDRGEPARFHRTLPCAVWARRVPVLAERARTASHCDTEGAAARRMDRSWALARHMTGSPPTPLLQRSKRERAFAHIVGETEANPFPLPHRSHAPQLAYFCGGNRGSGPILTRLCRRLATPTTVPIIARFFFGRFEGSMAGKPVAIIMGSQSDWPTMKHTADTLDALGIGYEAKIISAHRTPERHSTFTKAAKAQGFKIIIAGAGGAAHLPGVTAALTTLPVFGVPIESKALSGIDSLYSIVQMPPGVPVGTLAIGRAGAINAALLAASVLALADPALAERLEAWRQRQTEAVPETPEDGKS